MKCMYLGLTGQRALADPAVIIIIINLYFIPDLWPATWQLLQANITTGLQGILDLLKDPNERQGYAWIRLRIARLWPKWVKAIQNLATKQDLTQRRKQKV